MTSDPKLYKFMINKDSEDEEGALCDVVSTVLDIIGLPKPDGEC